MKGEREMRTSKNDVLTSLFIVVFLGCCVWDMSAHSTLSACAMFGSAGLALRFTLAALRETLRKIRRKGGDK